jgi:hypothetical protein
MKPPIAAVSNDPTRPLSQKTALGIRKCVWSSGSPGALASCVNITSPRSSRNGKNSQPLHPQDRWQGRSVAHQLAQNAARCGKVEAGVEVLSEGKYVAFVGAQRIPSAASAYDPQLGIDTSADVLGGIGATQRIAVEPSMVAPTQAWLEPLQGGLSMRPSAHKAREARTCWSRSAMWNPSYLLA